MGKVVKGLVLAEEDGAGEGRKETVEFPPWIVQALMLTDEEDEEDNELPGWAVAILGFVAAVVGFLFGVGLVAMLMMLA